jgi:hypothetical protein
MCPTGVLNKIRKSKVQFDPADADHVRLYREFMKRRNWAEGCPFDLEWPFLDLVTMIERKIVDHYVNEVLV